MSSKAGGRKRHLTVSTADVDRAFLKVKGYVESGRKEAIYAATSAKMHRDTVDNYLEDPDEARKAYKIGDFVECIAKLPAVRQLEKVEAYKYALKELRLDPQSQVGLRRYSGTYVTLHDFQNATKANLLELTIMFSE